MEHSNNLDEILISYILDESNAEQKLFVQKWLSKNDTNRLYYNELVRTSGLVAAVGKKEEIDIDNEWNVFTETTAAYENAHKRQNINKQNEIELPHLEGAYGGRRYKWMFAAAVAACTLVILSIGWKYFLNTNTVDHPIAIAENAKEELKATYDRHEVNNTGKSRRIVLIDGTIVTLSEKSEIRFSEPFEDGKRDIYLTGKAGFKVAKDKSRPFTVFSGDLSTTALGTEFIVTAFKNAKTITVRLFEGKVVIKSLKTAKVLLKKDLYLKPGQELVYNNSNAIAKITSFKRKTEEIAKAYNTINENVSVDNLNIPLNDAGSWFMFNNQSLSQIFDQLEGLYNVEIIYNKKDLQRRYFIGKFEKNDSLQNILKLITSLNGLVSEKKNDKYYISRQK